MCIDTIEKSIKSMKRINSDNLKEVASYYRKLSKIKELIEIAMEEPKKVLMENMEVNSPFIFPDHQEKVSLREGAKITEIESEEITKKLLKEGRKEDIIKCATYSQKSLNTLEDGQALIDEFKKEIGVKSNSLIVSKMTKQELKEAGI